jgi:two-component system cell cycle sensor histidine kinase/response regulator CckA
MGGKHLKQWQAYLLLALLVLMLALGWFYVFWQQQAITESVIAAYQQTELEIVRATARSVEYYAYVQIHVQGRSDISNVEQEIFKKFIKPIFLLKNGDTWIYAPDHVVFDLSSDFPDKYRGKNMAQIFALQKEMGASHYEEMVEAVMSAREGAGWYIWLPEKGKEIAAWTPVTVEGVVWTIGLSTPLPEILETTGAAWYMQSSAMLMALGTGVGLALLLVWFQYATARMRMEERLKFQAMLLEQVHDSIIATDLEGRITYANRTSREITGRTMEELLGQTVEILGEDPTRGATQREIVESTLRDGQWRGRVVNFDKEGREKVLDTRTQLVRDERGNPSGMCGISTDITEQVQVEAALRIKDNAIASSITAIAIAEFAGNLTYVNNSFLKMWGYDDESEVLGKPAVDFWQVKEKAWEVVEALHGGNSVTGELVAKRKDGSLFDVQLSASTITDETGKPTYMMASFMDITERKRAEEALRESEERFRSIFENVAVGLYRTTPDGRILMANPAFVRMLGYPSFEELAQRNLEEEEFAAGYPRAAFKRRVESKGQVIGMESAWAKRDGSNLFIRESARAVRDEAGKTLYYEGAIEDITERRKLEAQLLQAQKMEAVGTLAGGIAHEFNNLLTGIIGNLSLALAEVEPGSQAQQDLQIAERSARRAAALTRQLLAFSHKSRSERLRPLSLNSIAEEAATLLRQTIDRRIEVNIYPAADLWPVEADPNQMSQVLMNLCLNARDAIMDCLQGKCPLPQRPPGAAFAISIESSNVTLDEDYCRLHLEARPGQFVRLAVSDNGSGMDAETQARAFDPFFTTKEVGQGTGLGLAMVFGIVKGHGGFINLYSEPGSGSTFKVYLPRAEEQAAAETESEEEQAAALPTGSEAILLVDDDEAVRKTGRRILESQGYSVLLAGDGREALEIYGREKARIDLVLLDLTMPRMSGLETLHGILQLNPGAKVILASGYSANGPGSVALAEGAAAFVQKPFDLRELARAVRAALDD